MAFAVLTSPVLHAQINTSFGSGANLAIGRTALSRIGPGSTAFWFRVATVGGRSYCAETSNQDGVNGYTDALADTYIDVFDNNGTTLLASNDDTNEEPFNLVFSRACWIPTLPGARTNGVRLTPLFSNLVTPSSVQLRVVETTLFCPWFFIAGDYNAFSLLRNASGTALNGIVVTWRGLGGAVAGTTTVPVPPQWRRDSERSRLRQPRPVLQRNDRNCLSGCTRSAPGEHDDAVGHDRARLRRPVHFEAAVVTRA